MSSIRGSAFIFGLFITLVAVLTVGFAIPSAEAATFTWDNDTDAGDGSNTNFNNAFNWGVGQTGTVPGSADIAAFQGTGTVATNPNLTASAIIQGVSFATAGTTGFVLSADPTFALQLNSNGTAALGAINGVNTAGSNTISAPLILGAAAGQTQTFTQATGGTLVLSGNITSANLITGLALATGGTYTLSGTNSYNGTTTLANARLNLNSNSALGTGNFVIGTAGGSFDNTSGSLRTLSNGVSIGVASSFAGTNDLTFNGGLAFTANGSIFTTTAGRLTFNGTTSWGSLRTIKQGAGTLVLNAAGTGAGVGVSIGGVTYATTARIDAGFVEIGNGAAFGTGLVEMRTGGGLSANTPVTVANPFDLSTLNCTFGGSNNMTFNGNFVISTGASGNVNTVFITNTASTLFNGSLSLTDVAADNQTLTIDVAPTAGPTEFTNAIQNSSVTNTSVGSIIKAGGGTLKLSGASTYTGTTDVQNGTLQLAGSLATATVLNLGAGTTSGKFILGSSAGAKNQTVNRISTIGTGTSNAIVGGNAAVSTLTVNGTTSTTFAGVLGGPGANENNLALTKAGTHILTLSGANTYTGATAISAGTLSVTGSLNGTSGTTLTGSGILSLSGTGTVNTGNITVNGATAKFLQIGTVPSTRPVALTAGSVDGTGSIGAVTVNSGAGIVTHGNGTTAQLTMSSLSYLGAGVANVRTAQANPLQPGLVVTGALSTVPAGPVTVNLTTDASFWNSGLYNLIGYGSFSGAISHFSLGTVPGLSTRQSGALLTNGNNIAVQISGDAPKWTGKDDNNWAIGLNGTLKNWQLITAGTPTDYLDLDSVLFDDTATGSTSVNLGTAVAPGAFTFNNNAKPYTVNSTGNFSITSGQLIKNNVGSLTINTANTYTGGTLFNGGTLNIGNAGALGTVASRLTIGAGSPKTLDNTFGSALQLGTNIPQTWSDDFTFAGTNDLNMGTGTVTLAGAARTVTVNNGILAVGAFSSGTTPLTVNGAGALAVPSTTLVGLSGNGNIENKQITPTPTNATLTVNQSIDTTFSGTLRNTSSGDGSTLALSKTGTGTLTLSGVSSHTGPLPGVGVAQIGTTLTAGKIIVANNQALGPNTLSFGAGTGTLDIALDPGDDIPNPINMSSGGNIVLMSGRATPGPATNHTINQGPLNVIGNGTVTISKGSNVTSGTPVLTINDINMTAGAAGTVTFNPTDAYVFLSDVDNGTSVANLSRTLDLGGTTGGTITGNITQTAGTLGLSKTNTSTWTFTGTASYTGATTITSGVLNIGDGGATGQLSTGNLAVTNNATLNFNRSDDIIVPHAFSGTTGSINKLGTGAVTLTGLSTYSGGMSTYTGTLAVANGINCSTIDVNGGQFVVVGGLTNPSLAANVNVGQLIVTGAINSTATVFVDGLGSLDGTGTVGATTFADASTAVLANGNGGVGALTLSSLTFGGDATVNVRTASPGIVVTGALVTTPASGTVTINPTTTTGTWSDGRNNLISFGSFSGAIGNFTLGTVTGTLGARQSYGGLVLNGKNIALQVNGDTPNWTGAVNNQWSTAVLANPKNWKLKTAGTSTDFIANDIVIFDDSATGSTTVNINAANVTPVNAIFNNNALNYTITSTGGFGIGGTGNVTKNGVGTATLNTGNTYSGNTRINRGSLKLDFSAGTAPISDILSASSTLVLGGGNLTLQSKPSTNNTQTVASTQVAAGGSTVNVLGDSATSPVVLNMGAIAKSDGVSVVFTLPTGTQDSTNGITATNANTNGILYPSGIINSPGAAANNQPTGYTFVTMSGANLVPYQGATAESANGVGVAWGGIPAGGTGTLNYDVDATLPANIGSTRNVNTIRYTGTGITQPGTGPLIINGFLNAGTGPVVISQPVAVGINQELVLAAATSSITINNPISNTIINAITSAIPGRVIVMGPNRTTLNGVNTYTGATFVNGGTLEIAGSGSIESTTGVKINGSDAKLLYTSSTFSSRSVNVTQGTLDGSGSMGAVTVDDGVNNVVANGNGAAQSVTLSSLTFDGAGKLSVNVGRNTPTVAGISSAGTLTANGAAGSIVVDANSVGGWNYNTTYNLVAYSGGSIGGTGFPAFTKGTIAGISTRTTATLGNAGGAITLAIGPAATIVWTGLDNANWVIGATGGSKNWKVQATNVATDFLNLDDVLFTDAGASTALNISGSAVNVARATFTNSATAYSINGSGIATGALEKNGTGSLTINTANTYAAGTAFNGGTLNLGNAGALGSSILTIGTGNAKTLDAIGGPLTLSSNIDQNWNDDFTFTGTNDLNMGSGNVLLGGAVGSRTVTVSNGLLTIGSLASAPLSNVGLTKAGAGTLLAAGGGATTFENNVSVTGGTFRTIQNMSVAGNLSVSSGATIDPEQLVTVSGDLQVNGTLIIGLQNVTATGLTGNGLITHDSPTDRTLVINNTADKVFSGVIENGTSNTVLVTKQGSGSQTLAGDSTYTGNTALQAGTLVLGHGHALGSLAASNLLIMTTGTKLVYATDNIGSTDNGYRLNIGSGFDVEIVSDRATPGPGISHPLSTSADPAASTLGTGTLNFKSGPKVTSGIGNISFDQLNTSAGGAGTITLNPTTATVTIGTITKQSVGLADETFEFGGTSVGNQVTGAISNGVGDGGADPAIITVTKTNTSTWAFSGNSTYTGGTTINSGKLLINNTSGSGTGTALVTVNAGGTLGGSGIIAPTVAAASNSVTMAAGSNLEPGNSPGTLTFSPTLNSIFNVSAIAGTGGLKFELGAPGNPAASDHVALTAGTLNIGTLTFSDFTFTDIGGAAIGGVYTLFDAVSTITGSVPAGTASGNFGGFAATLSLDNTTNFDVLLTITGPATLPGDYNNDGKINAADYVLWRKNPSAYGGDPAGYNTWRANFGNPPGAGSSLPGAGGAVPEPGTCLLLCLSSIALVATRRVRRR